MRVTVRQALAQSGLVPIDGQVLLAHVLGADRAWLAAHAVDEMAPERADAFFALARRRRHGEPVAYLTGLREFWGLSIAVTPNVLIPRPETETVVECALARLPADRIVRILDLGTGSGAIALALAHERQRAHIVATDISDAALMVARTNARRLRIYNVDFRGSDWFANLGDDEAPFDMIVSNPPYVAAFDRHLSEGDLRYEPMSALVSGSDGLDALRTIIAAAPRWLVPGGAIVVEHGYDQEAAVRTLMQGASFAQIESARDLAGIPRVAAARLASPGGGSST